MQFKIAKHSDTSKYGNGEDESMENDVIDDNFLFDPQ